MIQIARNSGAALAALLVASLATPALAHTGAGSTVGFAAGAMHPLGGIDHLLAMIAVGIWAGVLGGRAVWAVPASFVGAMVAGALLGHFGGAWSPVEIAIALSVLLLGVAVALRMKLATPLAMAAVALFGLAHGHAHGAEAAGSFLGYAAGFVLATVGLHAIGVAIGSAGARVWLPRVAGAAIALAGIALFV